ncbi:MAG TPA: carbohydrate ABC transporter permease [Spirochaetales bacterium]|nr:carbohydrate ABC transporter permease [Spirochaetales bacterium]HRY55655.1 carbohydrate ABC transporter permease [Spirochaetia bacterium]HRZ63537.1 carbohydrate ABC transporter permease [Spirochaetia bacterium]
MASYVQKKRGILFPLAMALVLALSLFPIYWILATSLKTPVEVISTSPTFYPHEPTLQNYAEIAKGGYLRNVANSLVVTAASTGASLVLAFLASYALSRYRFPLGANKAFLVWIIMAKMLPPVVLAVPIYDLFARLRLVNSIPGLVLVYQVYTLPYCIWMLFGFVKALPREFEEAADIDGASNSQILWRIAFPLVRTGVVATAIFSVIVAWDEFLFALLFVRSPDKMTLPLVVSGFIGEFETLWGQLMAIGILATAPIMAFSRVVFRQMTSAYSLDLK